MSLEFHGFGGQLQVFITKKRCNKKYVIIIILIFITINTEIKYNIFVFIDLILNIFEKIILFKIIHITYTKSY